ncbi:MAG: cytochrome P450 [Acidimicrobiaceae bacterium]|nr:cytochrome P450 [Acidimicrobiaceae bacterium]MYA74143.1 cytochrome P450 [Acidimicrobiaceae bacterium]MYG55259.1 cytochrome P450 [Acidimicrobiaceae bacterium]MYJ99665.1 cytochrome P450 [Acidimicrobiaceae bacterium]
MTLQPGDINLASNNDLMTIDVGVPYEYFAVLRREAPVYWNPPPVDGARIFELGDAYEPIGFWVLSKYGDVVMASKDTDRFSAWENSVLWIDTKQSEMALAAQRAGMMGMDPPDHTQFRRLVQPGFTPRSINALEPHIRGQAAKVIGELAERGEAEFVFEVASELPMILLCEMMGIPQERRDEYMALGNATASFEFNDNFVEDQINLFLMLDDVVKTVTDAPDDTLISKYVHGEVDGRKLAPDEITQFFQTLSIAGHETTRNTTAHFVRLMDEHPDQKALLLEDLEGRLPNAIEEVLRVSPPVMQFCRTATEDIELRGESIRKGDKVYMSYISANRDEDIFDDPDTFDILRPNAGKHLAFGMGAHFCLGASLARLQLRCVLAELYTQLPDISLAEAPTPMYSVWFNALNEMPVRTCPVAH